MSERRTTMMDPPIESLMQKVGSKFGLVALASKRGRQINSYFNQLGEGLGAIVPPQVTSVARKPLSIAFEEIAADKIVPIWDTQQVDGSDESGSGMATTGATTSNSQSLEGSPVLEIVSETEDGDDPPYEGGTQAAPSDEAS